MRRGMVPRARASAAAERAVVRGAEVVQHLGEHRGGAVVVDRRGQRVLRLGLRGRIGIRDGLQRRRRRFFDGFGLRLGLLDRRDLEGHGLAAPEETRPEADPVWDRGGLWLGLWFWLRLWPWLDQLGRRLWFRRFLDR